MTRGGYTHHRHQTTTNRPSNRYRTLESQNAAEPDTPSTADESSPGDRDG